MLTVTEGSMGLTAELVPGAAWGELREAWARLAERRPAATAFLGAAWTSAWLAEFGARLGVQVVVARGAGGGVEGMLLLARGGRGRGPLRLRQLHLNTAGEGVDSVAVEHNALLASPGLELAVAAAMRPVLERLGWDEFVASGIPDGALPVLEALVPAPLDEVRWLEAPFVDLAQLRTGGVAYETVLSRNTRDQVRRSLKLYRERGPVALELASSVAEGHAFLAELAALHQARWTGRGEPGAFASAAWRAFHERLIADALPRGGVQLARVRAGDQTVGVLYNLVEAGHVSFYQSGLRYEEDNRLKPGLATQALLIQHCLEAGYREYDFLASEGAGLRYKQSLANGTRRLGWASFLRANLAVSTWRLARGVQRRLRRAS
ncbi:MAG: GNAT family N-acetyltransferase [Gemmatimonadales bacterium]|nr:GNAT family N-acetyltransferase [Gemmatimonadales bacterium]